MNKIIEDNLGKIRELCKEHNVKYLFVFGSVSTLKFNDESDVDFLVSFYPMDFSDKADTYFSLADKLEELLQRKVDLITDKSLSNPYFIESVEETKRLIYGKAS